MHAEEEETGDGGVQNCGAPNEAFPFESVGESAHVGEVLVSRDAGNHGGRRSAPERASYAHCGRRGRGYEEVDCERKLKRTRKVVEDFHGQGHTGHPQAILALYASNKVVGSLQSQDHHEVLLPRTRVALQKQHRARRCYSPSQRLRRHSTQALNLHLEDSPASFRTCHLHFPAPTHDSKS